MNWDSISGLYDIIAGTYNSKVYNELGAKTAEYIDKDDLVLECACGTGVISCAAAPKCHKLIATDSSVNMLKQAKKKCRQFNNVLFRKADIYRLNCGDELFDKVIAGNVIHLLDDPAAAVWEMLRVCKTGGKVIILSYINDGETANSFIANTLSKTGAVKKTFTLESYKSFFISLGLDKTEFSVIEGKTPCAVAVITVNHWHDMKTKELWENVPYADGKWNTEHLYEYLVKVNYGSDNIALRFFRQHLDDEELARILLEDFLLNDAEYESSESQLGAAVVLRMMNRNALKANKELVLKAQKNEVYWKRPCNNADDLKWLLD